MIAKKIPELSPGEDKIKKRKYYPVSGRTVRLSTQILFKVLIKNHRGHTRGSSC